MPLIDKIKEKQRISDTRVLPVETCVLPVETPKCVVELFKSPTNLLDEVKEHYKEIGTTESHEIPSDTSASICIYTKCVMDSNTKIFYSVSVADKVFDINHYLDSNGLADNSFIVVIENNSDCARHVKIDYLIY